MNAVPDVSIHFSFVDKVDDVDKDFDAVWSTVDLLSVIEKVEEKAFHSQSKPQEEDEIV